MSNIEHYPPYTRSTPHPHYHPLQLSPEHNSATRALLVQNQRLIERVKELETTMERTTKEQQHTIRTQQQTIDAQSIRSIEKEQKYEHDTEQHQQELELCQTMVVDRVRKATMLHLETKDSLLTELSQAKKDTATERVQRHRERGGLEGRLMVLETSVVNKDKTIALLKNEAATESKEKILRTALQQVTKQEYHQREQEHFEDMRLCQRLLENLQTSYQTTSDETLFALATEAQRVVVVAGGGSGSGSDYVHGGYHSTSTSNTNNTNDTEENNTTSDTTNTTKNTNNNTTTNTNNTNNTNNTTTNTTTNTTNLQQKAQAIQKSAIATTKEMEVEALQHQLKMTTIHWERREQLLKQREQNLIAQILQHDTTSITREHGHYQSTGTQTEGHCVVVASASNRGIKKHKTTAGAHTKRKQKRRSNTSKNTNTSSTPSAPSTPSSSIAASSVISTPASQISNIR